MAVNSQQSNVNQSTAESRPQQIIMFVVCDSPNFLNIKLDLFFFVYWLFFLDVRLQYE